jgi:hypothetical protein
MALDLHFGDKLLPGFQIAVGVKTNDKPAVKLRYAGGSEIPFTLTRMGNDRETSVETWKVRFKLPLDAKGEVEIDVKAGADSKTEKKAIG